MSKSNMLKKKYKERRHEDGSISELYYNYSNAVKYWLIAESKLSADPFSKHRRKGSFAIITAIACLTLMALISISSFNSGLSADNGFLMLTRLLVTALQPMELAVTEILMLLLVVFCTLMASKGSSSHADNVLLSFETLRSASSRRPNFLLGHDVVPLSGIAVGLYMDAFKCRRECLGEELGREPSSNGGVTLAVVVSVVLALLTQQSTAIVVLTLVVSALSLYFLTDRLTREKRTELVELSIYEMIIQDLQEIELAEASDALDTSQPWSRLAPAFCNILRSGDINLMSDKQAPSGRWHDNFGHRGQHAAAVSASATTGMEDFPPCRQF